MTDPVRYIEGTAVLIKLERFDPANTYPTTFSWTFGSGRQPLRNDSRRRFGYPSLIITNAQRSDSGLYVLEAANDVGVGYGSFTLTVLRKYATIKNYVLKDLFPDAYFAAGFGPEIESGLFQQVGNFGEKFTVLFGTNLQSSPPARFNITDPNGNLLLNRVPIANGDVTFNISNLTFNAVGVWVCNIIVEETDISRPGGEPISQFIIGARNISVNVSLLGKS